MNKFDRIVFIRVMVSTAAIKILLIVIFTYTDKKKKIRNDCYSVYDRLICESIQESYYTDFAMVFY